MTRMLQAFFLFLDLMLTEFCIESPKGETGNKLSKVPVDHFGALSEGDSPLRNSKFMIRWRPVAPHKFARNNQFSASVVQVRCMHASLYYNRL
jgi:hypothetical protein